MRAARLLHIPAPTAHPPPLSKSYQLPRTHRETRVQSHLPQQASSAAHENLCPGRPSAPSFSPGCPGTRDTNGE